MAGACYFVDVDSQHNGNADMKLYRGAEEVTTRESAVMAISIFIG